MLSVDANVPIYQQAEHTQQPSVAINSRPTVDFQQYRRNSIHLAGPTITYPQYPSANFSMPQVQQFSPVFASEAFQPSYPQQAPESQHQQVRSQPRVAQQSHQGYTPLTNATHHLIPLARSATLQDAELTDNSDGGVPVELNY